LRDGLLPNSSVFFSVASCFTTFLTGDTSDSISSSGIPPFSFSWELDGPAASLLATGVALLIDGFLNAGFLTEGTDLDFGMALAAFPVPLGFNAPVDVGYGVPLIGEDFVKKLWMDLWPAA
jgi:hypothetical protein